MVEQTTSEPAAGSMPKISFGVKKREENKVQAPAKAVVIEVDLDSDEEREKNEMERAAKRRKVMHFEDGTVQGDIDKPKEAAVIPMVVEHDWRTQKLIEKEKAGTLTEEERAKLALVLPNGIDGENEEESGKGEKIVVEDGRGDTEDADYSAIPIESFGLAILRGCNWKDGDGIGKNPQKVALKLPNRRPPGLGLGATPKNPVGKNKNTGESSKAEEEKLEEIKVGSFIKVVDGRNKGVYGKVEGRDDDSNSLFIRTAIGGKTMKVSQIVAVAVSAKEYERDSKCLNKSEYDKEKDRLETERKKLESQPPSTSTSQSSKDYKSKSSSSKHDKNSSEYERNDKMWARTDLLVRFIDEDFKRGSLYEQKVRIVDVAGDNDVTIEDDRGNTHYNIRQSWLETVIPREIGEKLMIVAGKRSGQLAVMLDKDKRKEKVTARLVATNDVVTAYFEDVCSVKIRHEEDYE
ncbi:G-patch domain and KOW motifs-containing protein homolog 1 [Caenorhabditis elegans]|uniref:G-patch domain and KOW motifs-containing protein homolog 1 n=1 Tax=Caenorhabditis elegans TaxID=6239 RepID=GPKOW_CAEEL|nr:G-patch domain and KOW motifs-containing protein homolog 1 [Caenorhabditis elegans]Q21924.1 RecName: Full=G-patch domain and KOW motifs-containing protein homolog 1; AltName: Full=Protein mos-2 homolog [Caenorhabditis elegans]CAA94367.1 G-patch domain and KOW motifs-containing protein homolog 1 [Caenorhabditis elegans]|eukprot:NP_501910.1 G-patch domain and KOW motifs-containing protein homolog 1 [Caenorhabditis elegans]